jgi:two-component system response regulator HydG
MKLGAFDYLQKPINPTVLQQKIELALTQQIQVPVKEEKVSVKKNLDNTPKVVKGSSSVMQRLYSHIDLVAPTKMSVLILGESGTGKEYIARMIHENSNRKSEPFVAVDCGSLSMELAPSELFGHKKGSFTSAISDKTGVFVAANGGTVFLDEIGNLSYEVQKQLLRALQEQKIRPVGSASDIKVDVRIIAATNENLEKAIEEGRFRQDLYHRINEFSLTLPPLRERIDDLEEFAYHFINQANDELGKEVDTISEEALLILKQQSWHGNLRELRNVIRRSVLFAQDNVLRKENLPDFPKENKSQMTVKIEQPELENRDLSLNNRANEKEQIIEALKQARGNKTVAAKLLQIDRKTLYNKMHLYGIEL